MLFILVTAQLSAQTLSAAQSDRQEAAVDTTFAVSASARLRLEASAGRLVVRAWDRSAVRLVATPAPGTTVRVSSSTDLVQINGSASGRIDEADYTLTVPRHMALTLGSGDLAIDIADCEADIVAKNYSGTISVSRTKGTLNVKSSLSEIIVQSSSGRLDAQAPNAAIRVTDFIGEIRVEGSANHVYLTRVDTKALAVSTISGVIWFSGVLYPDGRYSLFTHSGAVFFTLSEPVNATFHVSTVSGGFASAYPMTREEGPRRGRFTVKIGTGAASVDVETFNGGIVIRPPEATPKKPE
jgi:DUF4097 and DUF4098 domain-containing protein YvlB